MSSQEDLIRSKANTNAQIRKMQEQQRKAEVQQQGDELKRQYNNMVKYGNPGIKHNYAQDALNPTQGDFVGWSSYDEEQGLTTGTLDAGDVEANRADKQSWATQIGAGALKGLGNVATTAIGGTIGTLYGIGASIASGSISKLWDNDVSDAMNAVTDALNKFAPNYRNEAQQRGDWSSMLSANGLGSFLENAGFAAGAAISAYFTGGVGSFSKIGALARLTLGSKGAGIASVLAKGFMAAAGEAQVEAKGNSEEWADLKNQELNDSHNQRVAQLQALLQQDPNNKDALIQLQNENQAYEAGKKAIEENRTSMGNLNYFENIPLLMMGNMVQIGGILKSGLKTAKSVQNNLIRKATGITADRSTKGMVWKGANAFISEGREEFLQSASSATSGDYYGNVVDNFINKKRDPTEEEKAFDWMDSFKNAVTDKQNLQGAAFAAVSGGVGMPTIGKHGIGWQGGAYGEVKEYKENWEKEQSMADHLNEIEKDPKKKALFQGYVSHQSFQNEMNAALKEGRTFDYKNSEFQQQCSDIAMYKDAGLIAEYKQKVEEGLNTSPENLKQLYNATTNKDGTNDIYPDIDLSNPADMRKMAKMGEERKRKTLAFCDEFLAQRDKIESASKITLSTEQLNSLAWMKCTQGDCDKRVDSILKDDDTKKKLNDITEDLSSEMNSLKGNTDDKSKDKMEKLSHLMDLANRMREGTLNEKTLSADEMNDLRSLLLYAQSKGRLKMTDDEGNNAIDPLVDIFNIKNYSNSVQNSYQQCMSDPSTLAKKIDRSQRRRQRFHADRFANSIKNILNTSTTAEELGKRLQEINGKVSEEELFEILKESAADGNKIAQEYLNQNEGLNQSVASFEDSAKANGFNIKEDKGVPFESVESRKARYDKKVKKTFDTTKEEKALERNEARRSEIKKKKEDAEYRRRKKGEERQSYRERQSELIGNSKQDSSETNAVNAFYQKGANTAEDEYKEKLDKLNENKNELKKEEERKAKLEEEASDLDTSEVEGLEEDKANLEGQKKLEPKLKERFDRATGRKREKFQTQLKACQAKIAELEETIERKEKKLDTVESRKSGKELEECKERISILKSMIAKDEKEVAEAKEKLDADKIDYRTKAEQKGQEFIDSSLRKKRKMQVNHLGNKITKSEKEAAEIDKETAGYEKELEEIEKEDETLRKSKKQKEDFKDQYNSGAVTTQLPEGKIPPIYTPTGNILGEYRVKTSPSNDGGITESAPAMGPEKDPYDHLKRDEGKLDNLQKEYISIQKRIDKAFKKYNVSSIKDFKDLVETMKKEGTVLSEKEQQEIDSIMSDLEKFEKLKEEIINLNAEMKQLLGKVVGVQYIVLDVKGEEVQDSEEKEWLGEHTFIVEASDPVSTEDSDETSEDEKEDEDSDDEDEDSNEDSDEDEDSNDDEKGETEEQRVQREAQEKKDKEEVETLSAVIENEAKVVYEDTKVIYDKKTREKWEKENKELKELLKKLTELRKQPWTKELFEKIKELISKIKDKIKFIKDGVGGDLDKEADKIKGNKSELILKRVRIGNLIKNEKAKSDTNRNTSEIEKWEEEEAKLTAQIDDITKRENEIKKQKEAQEKQEKEDAKKAAEAEKQKEKEAEKQKEKDAALEAMNALDGEGAINDEIKLLEDNLNVLKSKPELKNTKREQEKQDKIELINYQLDILRARKKDLQNKKESDESSIEGRREKLNNEKINNKQAQSDRQGQIDKDNRELEVLKTRKKTAEENAKAAEEENKAENKKNQSIINEKTNEKKELTENGEKIDQQIADKKKEIENSTDNSEMSLDEVVEKSPLFSRNSNGSIHLKVDSLGIDVSFTNEINLTKQQTEILKKEGETKNKKELQALNKKFHKLGTAINIIRSINSKSAFPHTTIIGYEKFNSEGKDLEDSDIIWLDLLSGDVIIPKDSDAERLDLIKEIEKELEKRNYVAVEGLRLFNKSKEELQDVLKNIDKNFPKQEKSKQELQEELDELLDKKDENDSDIKGADNTINYYTNLINKQNNQSKKADEISSIDKQISELNEKIEKGKAHLEALQKDEEEIDSDLKKLEEEASKNKNKEEGKKGEKGKGKGKGKGEGNDNSSKQDIDNIRPAIPEIASESFAKHDYRPFNVVMNEKYKDTKNFDDCYNYLVKKGTFEYLNSGKLKLNDNIKLVIDPAFEDSVSKDFEGRPVVFMMVGDQVVGVMSVSRKDDARLTDIRKQILKEWENRKDKESKELFTSSVELSVTQLNKGKIQMTENETRPLSSLIQETPGDTVEFSVRYTDDDGNEKTASHVNKNLINKAKATTSNRCFVLVKQNDGTYSEVSVVPQPLSSMLTEDKKEAFYQTSIGKKLLDFADELSKVKDYDGLMNVIKKMSEVIYMGDYRIKFMEGSETDSQGNPIRNKKGKVINKGFYLQHVSGEDAEGNPIIDEKIYINFTNFRNDGEQPKDKNFTKEQIVEQIKEKLFEKSQHLVFQIGKKESKNGGLTYHKNNKDRGILEDLIDSGCVTTHALKLTPSNCNFYAKAKGIEVENGHTNTNIQGQKTHFNKVQEGETTAYKLSATMPNGKTFDLTLHRPFKQNEDGTDSTERDENRSPLNNFDNEKDSFKYSDGSKMSDEDLLIVKNLLIAFECFGDNAWGTAGNRTMASNWITIENEGAERFFVNKRTLQIVKKGNEEENAKWEKLNSTLQSIDYSHLSSYYNKTIDENGDMTSLESKHLEENDPKWKALENQDLDELKSVLGIKEEDLEEAKCKIIREIALCPKEKKDKLSAAFNKLFKTDITVQMNLFSAMATRNTTSFNESLKDKKLVLESRKELDFLANPKDAYDIVNFSDERKQVLASLWKTLYGTDLDLNPIPENVEKIFKKLNITDEKVISFIKNKGMSVSGLSHQQINDIIKFYVSIGQKDKITDEIQDAYFNTAIEEGLTDAQGLGDYLGIYGDNLTQLFSSDINPIINTVLTKILGERSREKTSTEDRINLLIKKLEGKLTKDEKNLVESVNLVYSLRHNGADFLTDLKLQSVSNKIRQKVLKGEKLTKEDNKKLKEVFPFVSQDQIDLITNKDIFGVFALTDKQIDEIKNIWNFFYEENLDDLDSHKIEKLISENKAQGGTHEKELKTLLRRKLEQSGFKFDKKLKGAEIESIISQNPKGILKFKSLKEQQHFREAWEAAIGYLPSISEEELEKDSVENLEKKFLQKTSQKNPDWTDLERYVGLLTEDEINRLKELHKGNYDALLGFNKPHRAKMKAIYEKISTKPFPTKENQTATKEDVAKAVEEGDYDFVKRQMEIIEKIDLTEEDFNLLKSPSNEKLKKLPIEKQRMLQKLSRKYLQKDMDVFYEKELVGKTLAELLHGNKTDQDLLQNYVGNLSKEQISVLAGRNEQEFKGYLKQERFSALDKEILKKAWEKIYGDEIDEKGNITITHSEEQYKNWIGNESYDDEVMEHYGLKNRVELDFLDSGRKGNDPMDVTIPSDDPERQKYLADLYERVWGKKAEGTIKKAPKKEKKEAKKPITENKDTGLDPVKKFHEAIEKGDEYEDWSITPEPTDAELAEDAVNDLYGKDYEDGNYRIVEASDAEIFDQSKELAWLDKVLPQISAEGRVKIIHGLIKTSKKGVYAWGQMSNGMMKLSDKAAVGTVYHEAFHEVFHSFLSIEDKAIILQECKDRYGDMTDLEAEELLADKFMNYVQTGKIDNGGNKSLWSRIKDFFENLKYFLTHFGKIKPHMNALFADINNAKYAGMKKVSQEEYETKYRTAAVKKEIKAEVEEPKTKKKSKKIKRDITQDELKEKIKKSFGEMDKIKVQYISDQQLKYMLSESLSSLFENKVDVQYYLRSQIIPTIESLKHNTTYKKLLLKLIADGKLSSEVINMRGINQKLIDLNREIKQRENENFSIEEYIPSNVFKKTSWDFIDTETLDYLQEKGITEKKFNEMAEKEKQQLIKCLFF